MVWLGHPTLDMFKRKCVNFFFSFHYSWLSKGCCCTRNNFKNNKNYQRSKNTTSTYWISFITSNLCTWPHLNLIIKLWYEHYYYCYYHFIYKKREVQKIMPTENDRADLEECHILIALLSSGSLVETLGLGLHPDQLNQNLQFSKIPRWCVSTLEFEKETLFTHFFLQGGS